MANTILLAYMENCFLSVVTKVINRFKLSALETVLPSVTVLIKDS